MPVGFIHRKTFRIEAVAKRRFVPIQQTGVQTVIGAIRIPEFYRVEKIEIGNRAACRIDIYREFLHAGFIRNDAAARTAIHQAVPDIVRAVIKQIGTKPAKPILVWCTATAKIRCLTVYLQLINELDRRLRSLGKTQGQRCNANRR